MYSITSPGLTLSVNAFAFPSLSFIPLAVFSTTNDGSSSTCVVTIAVSSTISGFFTSSGIVSPLATTVFVITLFAFPVISVCVTLYVAVISAIPAETAGVTTSPSSFSTASLAALNSPITSLPSSLNVISLAVPSTFNVFISTPANCSSKITFTKSSLPVFSTVILYSITSST